MIVATGLGQAHAREARATNPVTLTIWLPDYCSPATQSFFKNTFQPAFAKQYPQISAKIVYVDWSVYDQKVATAFAGGVAPDILETGASYVPDLVTRNRIISIDPYLPAWGHKGDFYAGAWEDTVWQGHNYGVPYTAGTDALVYRKSMLKAAGITHPPATWSELYADAVKLTKHDASGNLTQLGFLPVGGTDPIFYFITWYIIFASAGGSLVTPDAHHATIDTPAGLAAARLFVKLFQAQTPGGVGLSSKLLSPFASGKLAMEIQQESVAGQMQQYNPKAMGDVGVARPPLGPGPHATRVALTLDDWLAITTQAKDPGAAWNWVTFAAQPRYLSAYNQTCAAAPPSKPAVNVPWITNNPIYSQFVTNVYPYGQAFAFFPHIPEMWTKVGGELASAAYGKESVEQAMKNAEAESNTVLSGTATH
jgi:multiple sugar transport system substrate-binding protein